MANATIQSTFQLVSKTPSGGNTIMVFASPHNPFHTLTMTVLTDYATGFEIFQSYLIVVPSV